MKLINVTSENIETEHICCAISNNKDIQVISKKGWLKQQFNEGLVFLKCDVRGKCFIEYLPAENAWAPIEAKDYMYINCLWIAVQHKGKGYSNLLLDACIKDSKEKGKKGLVILSSKKKLGFLSDTKYMKHKGFRVADMVYPYFELLYLSFDENAEAPKFKSYLKKEKQIMHSGYSLYYTSQCPFTAKYIPLLKQVANQKNIELQITHIKTKEQAQHAPIPFTTFSLFYNDDLITHEILSEKKFEKILENTKL